MNPQGQSRPGNLDRTMIAFDSGTISITLDDLRLMASALKNYLQSSRTEIAKNIPTDLMAALPISVGDSWIDSTGIAHVGRWLLESRHGRLMLVWYALVDDAPVMYRYIASLAGGIGQWRILSMTVQTLG
jgi:hypothetical protein